MCNVKNPCICGTCSNDVNTYDGFKCFCPVGYTGPRCERALNCLDESYECKNGGQCVPRVLGDYVCSCPQPYCGLTCTNIVPQCTSQYRASLRIAGNCDKSFCNNRGTCEINHQNKTNGFVCHCSTGWLGDKCETNDPSTLPKFQSRKSQQIKLF